MCAQQISCRNLLAGRERTLTRTIRLQRYYKKMKYTNNSSYFCHFVFLGQSPNPFLTLPSPLSPSERGLGGVLLALS